MAVDAVIDFAADLAGGGARVGERKPIAAALVRSQPGERKGEILARASQRNQLLEVERAGQAEQAPTVGAGIVAHLQREGPAVEEVEQGAHRQQLRGLLRALEGSELCVPR